MMKIVLSLGFLFLAQTVFPQLMFRGTPDHVSNYQTNKQIIFTDEAWSLNVKAPVRSTGVASSTTVCCGWSEEKFYAIGVVNGRIKWIFNSGCSVESSPAINKGKICCANNKQTLFALDAGTGKRVWKYKF